MNKISIDVQEDLKKIKGASLGELLAVSWEYHGHIRCGAVSADDWTAVMMALGDRLGWSPAIESALKQETDKWHTEH